MAKVENIRQECEWLFSHFMVGPKVKILSDPRNPHYYLLYLTYWETKDVPEIEEGATTCTIMIREAKTRTFGAEIPRCWLETDGARQIAIKLMSFVLDRI